MQRKGGKADSTPARTSGTVLSKALIPGAAWTKESFPEFPDVVYWLRQAVGLFCGIAFGMGPALGLVGFIG
jgi:hypothetical protein